MSFRAFVLAATGGRRRGRAPYPYQERLAAEGLPALLRVPTGAGKTLSAVLPWLWRLMLCPEETVRARSRRRLVYMLPMRSLMEQTVREIQGWLAASGLDADVDLHTLMGGVDRDDDAWQLDPGRPAILVGTQDMIVSRLLMRGYAEPRAAWPVSFGLLHAGAQIVFDETQLMGPALQTSAQLQGLRDALGAFGDSASMWMSATLDERRLRTPDHPDIATVVELSDADRADPRLARRLGARKRVRFLDTPREHAAHTAFVARHLAHAHRSGTRTIAVLNQVDRAKDLADALRARLRDRPGAPEVVLMHAWFRPDERRRWPARLDRVPPEGQIVVATQVLEAGIDVSARLVLTEAARWSSIVQRAGRCNRGRSRASPSPGPGQRGRGTVRRGRGTVPPPPGGRSARRARPRTRWCRCPRGMRRPGTRVHPLLRRRPAARRRALPPPRSTAVGRGWAHDRLLRAGQRTAFDTPVRKVNTLRIVYSPVGRGIRPWRLPLPSELSLPDRRV